MKGNNGRGNTIERDDWQTPQWLFDKLNKQYKFDFDCCANNKNSKCAYHSEDFLNEDPIKSKGWMNPPFSKAKEMFNHFFKTVYMGIAIYRCDNFETSIWQDIIFKNADWVFIPKGRISYEGKEGNGSRFPSALIGYGLKTPKDIDGTLLFVKNANSELNIYRGNSSEEKDKSDYTDNQRVPISASATDEQDIVGKAHPQLFAQAVKSEQENKNGN